MTVDPERKHALTTLGEDDQEFIAQFVLASGSLKDLAAVYGVSYPTIRAKLDRVIVRLRQALDGRPIDPMAKLLANFVEKGELSTSLARSILDNHRRALKRAQEE
jgi:hypothetical protein